MTAWRRAAAMVTKAANLSLDCLGAYPMYNAR
jgi:hypothetical protein